MSDLDQLSGAYAERDALRARVEELEAGLADLIDHRNDYPTDLDPGHEYRQAFDRARALLSGGSQEPRNLEDELIDVAQEPTDDAIHMPDPVHNGRTLCDQPWGSLNVQGRRPDSAAGCWTCIEEHDRREPRPDTDETCPDCGGGGYREQYGIRCFCRPDTKETRT